MAGTRRRLACHKQALLILDDVRPGLDVEPLIPPRGECAVLVTTRYGAHPALGGAATPAEAALVDQILGDQKRLHRSVRATFDAAWDNLPAEAHPYLYTTGRYTRYDVGIMGGMPGSPGTGSGGGVMQPKYACKSVSHCVSATNGSPLPI